LNNLLAGLSLVMMLLVLGGCSTPGVTPSTARGSNRVAQDKGLLNRLVTELKYSPRSFIYLRSKGFTQSDKEFEQIIAKNDAVLRRMRIIRRDEYGVRQIPGWPGVALTREYKGSSPSRHHSPPPPRRWFGFFR
jgi:hypothetical protein